MSEGEIILYTTEDGAAQIQLRAVDGSVWLTQAQMAELFATTPQAITQLIRSIYRDGELAEQATCNEFLQVRDEGGRQVQRKLKHYNLEMILAVGYRVRSPRGVQFRRWATSALKEYLVKGFVMNDERLKDPAWDYFDELLERIRDIRASEARFYQKVRDILALSEDCDPRSAAVQEFYPKIQNKMLYAVTGHTAEELIRERADRARPNMGLTSWKGARVRKGDVTIARNYLGEEEIRELNLIVNMFLDTAEFRARRRQTMRLNEWEGVLDNFLRSHELPCCAMPEGYRRKRRSRSPTHAMPNSKPVARRRKGPRPGRWTIWRNSSASPRPPSSVERRREMVDGWKMTSHLGEVRGDG